MTAYMWRPGLLSALKAFFFFFNSLKLFFYWGIVGLHYCVSFCYIAEK